MTVDYIKKIKGANEYGEKSETYVIRSGEILVVETTIESCIAIPQLLKMEYDRI